MSCAEPPHVYDLQWMNDFGVCDQMSNFRLRKVAQEILGLIGRIEKFLYHFDIQWRLNGLKSWYDSCRHGVSERIIRRSMKRCPVTSVGMVLPGAGRVSPCLTLPQIQYSLRWTAVQLPSREIPCNCNCCLIQGKTKNRSGIEEKRFHWW